MQLRTAKQPTTTKRLIKPLMGMFMVFYIGYQALHGDRGLYALMRERRELAALQTDYDQTKAEREKLELKVSHLRDDSLDRDLLDEQMRRMLGVMKKGEIVILMNDKD